MAKQVRAAIYARVSTDDKGQNPQTQLLPLREYCLSRRWPYIEYVDRASGADINREALNQLKYDIAWHRVNTVVIYRFDRLARNLRELLELGDDWNRRNVDLISLSENVDTTSPQGRLVFQIFGAMAEFERSLIAERVRVGMARAKREGKRLGRPRIKVTMEPETMDKFRTGEISLYEAAKRVGVPRTTLRRRLIEWGFLNDVQKG